MGKPPACFPPINLEIPPDHTPTLFDDGARERRRARVHDLFRLPDVRDVELQLRGIRGPGRSDDHDRRPLGIEFAKQRHDLDTRTGVECAGGFVG